MKKPINTTARDKIYQLLKNRVKEVPIVQTLRELNYEKRFSGECYGCFRGVYETFEEAILSAPKNKEIGYDQPDLAKEYQMTLENQKIKNYDYPVLFWLKGVIEKSLTIFDFGGNVGIHYYLYTKYLSYPPELKWIVCDVAEITKAGEELAQQQEKSGLIFTNDFEAANDTDIFLASGSIQYVESLSRSLLKLTKKPKHLLINRLPLYNGKQFVTLQNGGMVYYPQYVFNRQDFIDSLCNIGYELIDVWKDREDSCVIPLHPKNSVPFYSGLYFRLVA